jgi:excisionase family DNA binding protein
MRQPEMAKMGTALNLSGVVPPNEAEVQEAADAARALAPLLKPSKHRSRHVRLRSEEAGVHEVVSVPRGAFELFVKILEQMSLGNAVTIVPIHAELTTQEAANLLNVSRPFIIGLLDQGKIPFHKTGTHRRIRFEHLLAYMRQEEQRQKQVMRELAAEAQKLDLGY